MGLAVDIRSPRDGGTLLVVGPYAIGYMAGVYLVVTMRGLMFRRNPLSVMFLSMLASLLAELIVVAFFSLRGMYSVTADFSAGRELVHRMLSSFYTALTTAWILALLFLPMTNLFGFQDQHARRFAGRRT
jgi:rod shape-determining protein MreD